MKHVLMILICAAAVFPQGKTRLGKFACSKQDVSKIADFYEKAAEFYEVRAACRDSFAAAGDLPLFNLYDTTCEWGNNGCPVSLKLPRLSDPVRRLGLSSTVDVEIILDLHGNVVSDRPVRGPPLLGRPARLAACQSRFSPRSYCGTPVMSHRMIRYLFFQG